MHAGLCHRSGLFLALVAVAGVALPLGAAEMKKAVPKLAPSGAPRVNLAACYEVDPTWPQKPDNVKWGEMPGVMVDGQDQVWIFTRANPPVQVYDRSGKLVRAWGEGLIKSAHYLRFDPEGNVWLADVADHVVMQFTPEGRLLRTLGTRGEPGCNATHFNRPTDMAITPAGDVFVSDGYGNTRIAQFDKSGKFVKQWGEPGIGPGQFSLPHSIVVDSKGLLYVADRSNVRVQVFDQNGKFLAEWRNLIVPWGMYSGKDDAIWVCGSSPQPWRDTDELLGCPPKDQVFMKFSPAGKVLQLWTLPFNPEMGQEKPGELDWLHGIAVDSHGDVYVGDIKGHRVQKLVPKP